MTNSAFSFLSTVEALALPERFSNRPVIPSLSVALQKVTMLPTTEVMSLYLKDCCRITMVGGKSRSSFGRAETMVTPSFSRIISSPKTPFSA